MRKFLLKSVIPIVCAPLFLLSACSLLNPVTLPTVNTYQLTQINPNTITGKPTSLTLLISAITSAPPYEGTGMAYMEKSYQLGYFTQNLWVSSPADMLEPLLRQSLQNTGHFKAVATAPYAGFSDVRLDITVLEFYQDFRESPYVERVTLNVQIVNVATHRAIASQVFSTAVPTEDKTPYGGVKAANQAVAELLAQITQFVVNHTQSVATSPMAPVSILTAPHTSTATAQFGKYGNAGPKNGS